MAALLRVASQFVPVRLLASSAVAAQARRRLPADAAIELVDVATNDCWVRDYGPTFVLDGGELVGVHWRFNAWGGKYPPWDLDAAAGRAICQAAGAGYEPSPLGLEGGAIDGDGRGRLLTTPDCLQTASRNPGWNREQIVGELYRRLGATEILWLDGGGLQGDDTDGHIDQLARFVSTDQVVCAVAQRDDQANHLALERNHRQLVAWADQTSPPVTVHRLPLPPPRCIQGTRVPESYCNFLMLGTAAVLVPTFGNRRADDVALGILGELLPGRELIGIDAQHFAWGLGAWHCASQQQPAASLQRDGPIV